MTSTLPKTPNLDYLKKQAKLIRKGHRAQDVEMLNRIRSQSSKYAKLSDTELSHTHFSINDAQFILAREYGFPSWAQLKLFVKKSRVWSIEDVQKAFKYTIIHDNTNKLRKLKREHPEHLASIIDKTIFNNGTNALVCTTLTSHKKIEMLETLLECGADINAVSQRGYTPLQASLYLRDWQGDESVTQYLLEQGAALDAWSASGLGELEILEAFLKEDPSCVNRRGPGGRSPLHFAKDGETMDLLLAHGAKINLRCQKYGSTPAQYFILKPERLRPFLERGARPDIFITCMLDDAELAQKLYAKDPQCIHAQSTEGDFAHNKSRYGCVYPFYLGGNQHVVAVANRYQKHKFLEFINKVSSEEEKLLFALYGKDSKQTESILRSYPTILETTDNKVMSLVSNVIESDNLEMLKLLLKYGLPIHNRDNTGLQPIHYAACRGRAKIMQALLDAGADVNASGIRFYIKDNAIKPLTHALSSSKYDPDRTSGDYPATITALLEAGSPVEDQDYEFADETLTKILRKYDQR